jgi:hypothetical protein
MLFISERTWRQIREHFTEGEKAKLRTAIANNVIGPVRGWDIRSGRGLDGSVNVTGIRRNGRLTPVPAEVLLLMEDAAAEDAIASGCPTVSEFHLELLRRPLPPRRK